MLQLRYAQTSPFVRKVVVLAAETGLTNRIEYLATRARPTAPDPEFALHNPLMKVPALVLEDGTTLFDSPVICEYLDSLHGGRRMIPAEGPARWTALRDLALADGLLDAAVLRVYETKVRPEPFYWREWDAGQQQKVANALRFFEANAPEPGADVDMVRIALGCCLGYLDFRFAHEPWREGHPRLARWFAGFCARESMAATVPVAVA